MTSKLAGFSRRGGRHGASLGLEIIQRDLIENGKVELNPGWDRLSASIPAGAAQRLSPDVEDTARSRTDLEPITDGKAHYPDNFIRR